MGILNMKILVILNIVDKCCNYLNYLIQIRWLVNICFWFICFFLNWVKTEEISQVQINIGFASLLFFKLFFFLLLTISNIFSLLQKSKQQLQIKDWPIFKKASPQHWSSLKCYTREKIFSQLLRNSIYCYFHYGR